MAKVSRSELIQDYNRVAEELDKKPTLGEYNEHGEYSSTPIYRRFESFEELKEQAGFETGQRKISDEKLLTDLRRVADEIGHSPTVEQYRERGEHDFKTYKRRWGSWYDVLEEADLSPTKHSEHWEGVEYDYEPPEGNVDAICDYCGGDTKKWEHELKSRDNVFCNRKCKAGFMAEQTGEEARSWNGGKVKIQCELCGVHFPVKPSEVDTRRFCGPSCTREWKSERFSGETHPRWTENPKELHYGPSFPKQRKKALERDEYECQVCGKSDEQNRDECHCGLNAHHIRKFREYDDHEQANQLANLIMLCSRCHQHVENNTITVPSGVWHRQEATKAVVSEMPLAKDLTAFSP